MLMTTEMLIGLIQVFFLFLITVCILLYIRSNLNNRNTKYNETEYITLIQSLTLIISSYKETVFIGKRQGLFSKHTIHEKSLAGGKLKETSLYQQEYHQLLSSSAKEVIRFLSTQLYERLLTYYSEDGLALFIIENLKK